MATIKGITAEAATTRVVVTAGDISLLRTNLLRAIPRTVPPRRDPRPSNTAITSTLRNTEPVTIHMPHPAALLPRITEVATAIHPHLTHLLQD